MGFRIQNGARLIRGFRYPGNRVLDSWFDSAESTWITISAFFRSGRGALGFLSTAMEHQACFCSQLFGHLA
jgi:hypothetical protein